MASRSIRAGSLRAPHNGHLDILARSGVIGFGLWILFLGAFALGHDSRGHRGRAPERDLFW